MDDQENKPKKALFHGFPDEDNVQVKNVLSNLERTFLPIGSEIGRYRIIEEIDRGGMAVVYKACQKDLDRIVALKVLPANVTINHNFVERFLTEAHSVAKLQHQNIVTIFEVSVETDIYFLAMDYLPGNNLFYYLNQQKPKLVQVLEIIRKLSDALAYAHDQKILHRDLKLNNVIMRDNEEPVLIDFGLAKVIGGDDTNLTRTGEIIGSPAYMAPERIFGKGLDARSDVCSLGIMLYEMLTFKNPYLDPRSMVQTTKNVVEAHPVPPRNLVSWLPIEVESITLKAMAGDPDERYQGMKEFGEDIARYQRGEPILARPPSLLFKIRRFLKKHWAPIAIGSISVLFTVLILFIISLQSRKEQSRWQLAFQENFASNEYLDYWYASSGRKGTNQRTGVWNILDSTLYVESSGYSFFRLERPLTRDIRVEFDIKTGLKDLYNAGFFIAGTRPDNGYAFRIHHKGSALNAVTYPGSKFLFYDYKPVTFPVDSSYHAVVEKKDHVISFWLNDVLISKVYDFFPKLGKAHQKLGFYVNGSTVAFDNLKIYRRAVPRLARPTIIADRFWEQGDFETALAEYREVLVDHYRSDIARQIRFKMIDCLIRLRKTNEAKEILADIISSKKTKEGDKARILFLQGMLHEKNNRTHEMNYAFSSLAELYPQNPINKSAASYMLMACYDLFAAGKRDSAESRIIFLMKKYPDFSHHFGRLHLKILEYYLSHGYWKKALNVGKKIITLHKADEEILFEGKILLAKKYLGRREKHKGVDILNQCLASSQPSIAKWHAWLTMAEVYEFEHKYNDAYTIYKKVFNDCPKSIPASWMAHIRMAETAFILSQEDQESSFKFVIDEPHVFAEPRLIAQFYTNMIEPEYFKRKWLLLNPKDVYYLYYLASKAMMENRYRSAGKYLKALRRKLSPQSWDYVRITSILDDLNMRKGLQYHSKK